MSKIWVFGDSFASSNHSYAWTSLLSDHGTVINEASNGSSEHRIWKKYQTNKQYIKNNDIVIFCHTSPSRIFLKDTAYSLSRVLPSHPLCDLIFNDIFAKNEKRFIKLLKEVWDEEIRIESQREDLLNKPEKIRESIAKGRVEKTLKTFTLLNQSCIRDPQITVEEFIKNHVSLLGENIQISRFCKYIVGENN